MRFRIPKLGTGGLVMTCQGIVLNIEYQDELIKIHQGLIDSRLAGSSTRQEYYGKSIAVESKAFNKSIDHAMKSKAIGRRMIELPAAGYP